MSEDVIEVTDATFEQEVLKASLPVLVDFWATWCGPCRTVGPVVEAVAQQFKDRLKVAKVNVDDNVNVPSQYGIRSIPSLLFFRDGELVDQVVGAVPEAQLVKTVDKVLGT